MLDLVFGFRNWKEKLCSIQHLQRSLKFLAVGHKIEGIRK
jgi:hypothetical protein